MFWIIDFSTRKVRKNQAESKLFLLVITRVDSTGKCNANYQPGRYVFQFQN